jgi:hypothetical protein
MAIKMFMNMKIDILKELCNKIAQENLMTDELITFFKNEIDEIKSSTKQMSKSLNKINKKKRTSSMSSVESDSDETSESKQKKIKKEKRPPTDHQRRVSRSMMVLKDRFPQVKHQIRLGTSNFMATFIKNEYTDIDFDDSSNSDKIDTALNHAIQKMNERKEQAYEKAVYPVTELSTNTTTTTPQKTTTTKNEASTSSTKKTKKNTVAATQKKKLTKNEALIDEKEQSDTVKKELDSLEKELNRLDGESEEESDESDNEW